MIKRGLFIFLVIAIAVSIFPTSDSSAGAEGFSAGRIIDDNVFTNKSTMTASSIQSFLNSEVSVCDTWGDKPSEYGGGTRRQWAEANGHTAPFICLKDYSTGGRSAAQIIYDVAQKYSINPQVLLVLLQKEQGLVTDEWPVEAQYRSATGYGCPDTAPCDSQYYGLVNQLDWAAKMFRNIIDNVPQSEWYTPYVLGNNFIAYNPESSCGGTTVNIENRATQALYNYTPYQPNQAALSAGYGSGNSCSSYGNRNFYLYFRDWFGATKTVPIPGCTEATNTSLSCVWKARDNARGIELITTDYNVISNYVNGRGYSYLGKIFVARNKIAPRPGNIPIYSLTMQSGATFVTPDRNEYDTLVSAGNSGNGIMFYTDPANSNSGYPVYRLHNSSSGQHAWTASISEVTRYKNDGFTLEGTNFTALSPVLQERAAPAGQDLVYRFRDLPEGRHFWTADVYERDQMIRAGYKYDGVGWRSSKSTNDTPVYRLYSPTMKKHLYTTDAWERQVLDATSSWRYEKIAFYASKTNTTGPVFRLYKSSTAAHLYTSDAYEKSVLTKSGVFRDEGTSWYQP